MLKKSTILIIQVLSLMIGVFSTYGIYAQDQGVYYGLSRFLFSGFIFDGFFTPFEIALLALIVNIMLNYSFVLRFNNKLFLFALLAYIVRMINPYAETATPILGMPLLSNLSEYLLLLLILLFSSIPPQMCKLLIEKVFRYVLFFSTLKAIVFLLRYAIGTITTFRYDYAVILPEPDTQFLFSFLGSVLFAMYLSKKDRKLLLLSVMFFFIVTFSMQRSTALTGIIALTLLISFSLLKGLPFAAGRAVLIVAFLFVITQIVITQLPDSKITFVVNRYSGVFVDKYDATEAAFGDTGHKEQSITVFMNVLKENPFWGTGYGNINKRLYIDGQTSNIHNNFATLWAQHGIITLLFYMNIFIIIVFRLIKLILITTKYNFEQSIMQLTTGFYLLGYFAAAWVSSGNIFMHSRFLLFWFLIFIYFKRTAGFNFNERSYAKVK